MKYIKELCEAGTYDVVVCGGGPAGYCAAVQAARAGAKTVLVEQYGSMGGVLTTGGNPEIGLFYAGSRQIISGIGWETVCRLSDRGWAHIPVFTDTTPHYYQNVSVNGPMMSALMDEVCCEAGVDVRLHHQLCDVITQGERLSGIVVATKTGLQYIQGSYYIDATGDGDLAAYAGAKFHLGDDSGALQPGTLRFYWTNVNTPELDEREIRQHFANALASGELKPHDHWSTGSPIDIFTHNGNNINHIAINGANSLSRAEAEVEGRRSVVRLAEWARKHLTGAQMIEPIACGVETAVRESRRIVCDHTITVDEYVNAQSYEDGLCYSFYPIDLHMMNADETVHNVFLEKGRVPQIPLRAMLVKGFENILVSGRCISGDRLAQSAYRVKASCMAMGQAAGAAAACAIAYGSPLRCTSIEDMKICLINHGAIIPV